MVLAAQSAEQLQWLFFLSLCKRKNGRLFVEFTLLVLGRRKGVSLMVGVEMNSELTYVVSLLENLNSCFDEEDGLKRISQQKSVRAWKILVQSRKCVMSGLSAL